MVGGEIIEYCFIEDCWSCGWRRDTAVSGKLDMNQQVALLSQQVFHLRMYHADDDQIELRAHHATQWVRSLTNGSMH